MTEACVEAGRTAGDRRVLIVDDSPDDVVLTEAALRRAGFCGTLDVARDGVEALDRLIDTAVNVLDYAVVLLDVNLPRLSGMEVLARARAAGVRLPIVVVSTSRQPAEIERALALGANEYVPKDVDFDAWCQAMRGLCERWLGGAPAAHTS